MMNSHSMSCDLFNEQLLSYLEHETDDATRIAIERHSVTCGECGALLADLRKLRIDAANLPALQPSRDLWSGIAARIEAPVVSIGTRQLQERRSVAVRRWMRGATIAASLVAAAGVGYFAAGTRTQLVPTPVVALPEDSATQVVATFAPDSASPPQSGAEPSAVRRPRAAGSATPATSARPIEAQLAVATLTADYDREIARLRTLIEQRRNQLDPVTVAIIEKNLKVIDTAIEDSKKAIVRDPASRFLIESLNQSLQSKVELMRTAALLPSRT